MADRVAGLITHSHPPATTDAVSIVATAAENAGWRLVATADEAAKHGETAAAGIETVDSLPRQLDLCIVLGGDGSILYALRHFAHTGVPVFGVNFGTVGFLAAVERDGVAEGIRRALAGETEVVRLPGLEVEVDGRRRVGLNDVGFVRRPHGRVAELSYGIGGEEVGHVRCDGLVAATPAGSTGYNLANGGPVMAWGVEGLAVSFIAPHSLTARALVVAPQDPIAVRSRSREEPVDVSVDGRPICELAPGGRVSARFRDGVGTLAQVQGASFYHRLREKFGRLASGV